jgi:tRNA(Ile2) C34 agmatinyltransferase TiaS
MPALVKNNVWMGQYETRAIPMEGKEVRCSVCGQLLCKGDMAQGSKLEFKCHRCRNMIRFWFK